MRRSLVILIAALCLTVSFVVSSAQASSAFNRPRVRVKDGTSTNWSGYAVETNLKSPQSNVVTDVKGNWTIPTVVCGSSSTWSSVWVGIDGYSDGTVEQTGTEQDCSRGRASYYAWYEMYPRDSIAFSLRVKPGDAISTEVNYNKNNQFVLTLQDLTQRSKASVTQTLRQAGRSSAEWIVEAPSSNSGVLPLADFRTVSISGAQATINGRTGGISNSAWQFDKLTMVNSSNAVKAAPSGLSGSGFSVTWSSS